jgi:hypothetical protein
VRNMKFISKFVAYASVFFMFSANSYAEGMCKTGEKIIFNCQLKDEVASICLNEKIMAFVYRDGTAERLNLQVPRPGERGNANPFYFSNVSYAGGGEAHVRFSQGGYDYYLYDKTIKSDDGPEFSSGVVVLKNNQRLANLVCNNDAAIHHEAYGKIPKEAYRDIGAK